MNSPQFLKGRHAIVTGGGKGIGAAIAKEFARQGASLTLMGRDVAAIEGHGKKLAEEFGIDYFSQACDVTDADSVTTAFSAAIRKFGDAYILVNNAGQAEPSGFAEMPKEFWDRMLAVNLTGTYLCSQQVISGMTRVGSGRIVNIASTAGLKGYARITAYCAAKHGVVGLTRALALEVAKSGVTVNALCPGYTDTGMTQRAIQGLEKALGKSADEARQMLLRNNPRGTFIAPEEVAAAVVWLCSPESSALTGLAIPISAGEVM